MKLEWFGRYRNISAALVQFSNCMIKTAATEWDIGEGVYLTGPEWQVLELIIENDDGALIMSDYAKMLGLPKSTVSKIAKKLLNYDLIARFRVEGNNKTIILKPTQRGKDIYFNYVTSLVGPLWNTLFEGLSSLDDNSMETVAEALRSFTNASLDKSSSEEKQVFIKL